MMIALLENGRMGHGIGLADAATGHIKVVRTYIQIYN
jgi:hypothetical protein